MDAKFSRLKDFLNENNHNNDNSQSWSRAIFSRDLFQTNMDQVHSFFSNREDTPPSSSTDDMQLLLQKGDKDPILPALVNLPLRDSAAFRIRSLRSNRVRFFVHPSESKTANSGLYDVPRDGHYMHVISNSVHTRSGDQSTKICTTILIWQYILSIEVCRRLEMCSCPEQSVSLVSLQFLDALGTNKSFEAFDQHRASAVFDYLSRYSHRHNLLFCLGKDARQQEALGKRGDVTSDRSV